MTGVLYAADTSVVIAALMPANPVHALARHALLQAPDAIAHVLAESYSVLTRLPAPLHVEPHVAAGAIAEWMPGELLTLPGAIAGELPALLASAGVAGGSTYDAVVGLTARHWDRVLLTCDRRATTTYRALGVTHRMV